MSIIEPGSPLLFMKVGTHANEDLESIIKRKREEIDRGGYAMWGYGGSTCHPLSMVRPFAQTYEDLKRPIRLVMEVMESKHFAEPVAADEYSVDGQNWIPIDTQVHRVLGSRYALFIKDLRLDEITLSLTQSKVALGPSEGRRGDLYIQGRVDKACLVYASPPEVGQENIVRPINLVADLVSPYAALLRNKT